MENVFNEHSFVTFMMELKQIRCVNVLKICGS